MKLILRAQDWLIFDLDRSLGLRVIQISSATPAHRNERANSNVSDLTGLGFRVLEAWDLGLAAM